MRRHFALAAALAGLLVVSACGSGSGTGRTVTAVVTVSSGADASGSPEASGGAPASGESAASGSASESASPSPSSSGAAPIVTGIDPLKVDCGAIISAADIKRIFNVDIPNDRIKKTIDVSANKVGQTGQIRCLYGLSADKNSGAFSMLLTQYTDAAAAQKQAETTAQTLSDGGATNSPTTVNGYPATLSLKDGGLVILPYDTWTMSIASFSSTPIDPGVLQTGLPQLADAALTRILKS